MDPVFSGKKVSMKLGPVRRALAAVCVLPLLLAGCSDAAPTPEIPDPTTSSPSAGATETGPVEPTLPPEAEGDGVEAAEAFIPFYLATVDYSRQTMDADYIRELSAPTCRGCTGLADLIQKMRRNGGTVVGGDQTVRSVQAEQLGVPGSTGKLFRAVASVRTTDQEIKNSGVDGLDGLRPAETLKFGFVVLKNGQDWTVSEWDVL